MKKNDWLRSIARGGPQLNTPTKRPIKVNVVKDRADQTAKAKRRLSQRLKRTEELGNA